MRIIRKTQTLKANVWENKKTFRPGWLPQMVNVLPHGKPNTAQYPSMHLSTKTPAYPSVVVWEQLHCFFFARRVWGGRRARALNHRCQPGSQAGATTGNPKQRGNVEVAPTHQRRGRRQWRHPLNCHSQNNLSTRSYLLWHCCTALASDPFVLQS